MASAAIGAVGSIAGTSATGKGAAKAAKIEQQTAQQQTAALQKMYEQNVGYMMPTYNSGQNAETALNTALGLPGGSGTQTAEQQLQATPGYDFTMKQALASANSNAYAAGLGNSGAALKSLQDRASGIADTTYNNYVSQLGTVADRGVNAMNGLVSQGNTTTAAENTESQNAADAAAANSVYQGNNLANLFTSLSGDASKAYGSSFGGK